MSGVHFLKLLCTVETVTKLLQKYYNIMGPPSYMRSVVDRNVVMRRIPVYIVDSIMDYSTRPMKHLW